MQLVEKGQAVMLVGWMMAPPSDHAASSQQQT